MAARVSSVEAVALIDGERTPLASARLALTDEGVARGDGAFETVGVWGGQPFRLDDHLERIDRSLTSAALPTADRAALRADVEALLSELGEQDAALRMYVTASGTRIVTLSPPPERLDARRLEPQPAPWIRPLGTFAPAGAKTMSYLPNMAATRMAVRRGADDALLVSLEGWVLEGPTFAVLWVSQGRLFVVPTGLGIVDSISRRTLITLAEQLDIPVVDEPRPLDHLLAADEVMICSSVRSLLRIEQVADQTYPGPTPVRDRLADALEQARRGGF